MALSRNPLAPDPGYEKTCNFYPRGDSLDPPLRGRVRPEAMDIARLHTAGSVSLLFHPEDQVLMTQRKYRRPDPKRHARENLRRIREIQEKSRRKREEEVAPTAAPPKKDRFDHVQPKVTVYMQHTTSQTPKPAPLDPRAVPRVPINGSPLQDERPQSTTGRQKNFLAVNVANAGTTKVKRPPSQCHQENLREKKEKELTQYHRGAVPQYLRQRQEQWRRDEEERLASLPDPSIPPGHTLMPKEERIKTLQILREHEEAMMKELQSLPIRSDTLRVRTRKSELEGKLAEVEDAIKIFSRPKVFIKLNE